MATTTTRRTRAKITPIIELDSILSVSESRAVYKALRILDAKLQRDDNTLFDSPAVANAYFACKLGGLAAEAFAVAYLDAQNRVIETKIMFTGTLTQTTVHPREIVKASLAIGAAAVVVSHNHPSGALQFSEADRVLTHAIKRALEVVDVHLHDHILVAGGKAISGAQHRLF
jgi:DNA repair protein RadC